MGRCSQFDTVSSGSAPTQPSGARRRRASTHFDISPATHSLICCCSLHLCASMVQATMLANGEVESVRWRARSMPSCCQDVPVLGPRQPAMRPWPGNKLVQVTHDLVVELSVRLGVVLPTYKCPCRSRLRPSCEAPSGQARLLVAAGTTYC